MKLKQAGIGFETKPTYFITPRERSMRQPTNKDVMSLIKNITITTKDISDKQDKFIDYQMDFNKRIEAKVDKLYTLPTIKKELVI